MIDSPDAYRPHDGRSVAGLPDARATAAAAAAAATAAGTSAGAAASPVPPALVRRAVRGLRELESRRARARFREMPADVGVPPGSGADEDLGLLHGLLAELRAGTTVQVCALRARGEPPERVLCEVKRTLRSALEAEGWGDPATMEPLMRRVVEWSIAAYYDR